MENVNDKILFVLNPEEGINSKDIIYEIINNDIFVRLPNLKYNSELKKDIFSKRTILETGRNNSTFKRASAPPLRYSRRHKLYP